MVLSSVFTQLSNCVKTSDLGETSDKTYVSAIPRQNVVSLPGQGSVTLYIPTAKTLIHLMTARTGSTAHLSRLVNMEFS